MLSMQATNTSSTDQANFQRMCRYWHLVSLPSPCVLPSRGDPCGRPGGGGRPISTTLILTPIRDSIPAPTTRQRLWQDGYMLVTSAQWFSNSRGCAEHLLLGYPCREGYLAQRRSTHDSCACAANLRRLQKAHCPCQVHKKPRVAAP